MPTKISFLLTLCVSVAAYFGAQFSPLIGYGLAILSMLLIGFVSKSVWPTLAQKENPIIFSLFWGLIIGLLIPFLIKKISNDGFQSIIDLMLS